MHQPRCMLQEHPRKRQHGVPQPLVVRHLVVHLRGDTHVKVSGNALDRTLDAEAMVKLVLHELCVRRRRRSRVWRGPAAACGPAAASRPAAACCPAAAACRILVCFGARCGHCERKAHQSHVRVHLGRRERRRAASPRHRQHRRRRPDEVHAVLAAALHTERLPHRQSGGDAEIWSIVAAPCTRDGGGRGGTKQSHCTLLGGWGGKSTKYARCTLCGRRGLGF
mmetsp:Transcript_22691/g.67561  ORF Transcript_22691/g.67561 Transcript_22691/m.67561 type:complete len:223 (-) Transcript_22691:107-775(-)|eukprot:365924-Chlamydomonas_euryale.AAC.2